MRTGGRTAGVLILAASMVVSAALLVSGCGGGGNDDSGTAASTGHPPIVGTSWLMQSYSKPGGLVTELHEGVRLPSLKFKPDDTVQVFDGCNSGGGKATVNDDGTIKFGPVMTTLMGCPGETADVSSAVLQVLQGTADYSFDGPDLVLKNGDQTLTYSSGDA